jgi:hypothetical protein
MSLGGHLFIATLLAVVAALTIERLRRRKRTKLTINFYIEE